MSRMGQLSVIQLEASDLAGDSPRHGELAVITLEAVDDPGSLDPVHGELTYMRLIAVTLEVEDFVDTKAKSWTIVTTTATLTDGTQPDTWTWAQDSGPTVDLSVNGNVATFVAPANIDTEVVVISVYATKQGGDSAPKVRNITIRPHQHWRHNGTTFVPYGPDRIGM